MVSSYTAVFVQTYDDVSHVSSGRENSMRVENPIALGQCPSYIWPDLPKLIVNIPRRGNLAFASIRGLFESVQTKDATCVRVERLDNRTSLL